MLSAVSAILVMALIAVLLAAFYFLDRLIRYEYSFHREQWERDGRPNGFFFRPPERRWFRSGLAFHRCALGWPLYTPDWVRDDPTARRLHRRLRVCVLIWNVGFISFIVFIIPYLTVTLCI